MKNKFRAAVIGVILAIGALAGLGLSALTKGCEGGGFGLHRPGPSGNSSVTSKGKGDSTTGLVITLEGEQYSVEGSPRSFEEVVSAAAEASKNQASEREPAILIKKKNARYMTVQKLEDELNRRGIRYRTEDDFR